MGPRNAEETTAFGLITRSVMNTLRESLFGRSSTLYCESLSKHPCRYSMLSPASRSIPGV